MAIKFSAIVGVRSIHPHDIDRVVEIEAMAFVDNPWDDEAFSLALQHETSNGIVASLKGSIVGYTVFDITPRRLKIMTMGVDPSFRRQGVGTAMLGCLLKQLRVTHAIAAVDQYSLDAQLFLQRALAWATFRATRIMKSGNYMMEWRAGAEVKPRNIDVNLFNPKLEQS